MPCLFEALFCLFCPYTNFYCLNASYVQLWDFICLFGGHADDTFRQNVHTLSLAMP